MTEVGALLWAAAVVGLAAALMLLRARREAEDRPARDLLRAWSLSSLAATGAAILFALRGAVPEALVLGLGNALILLARAEIWAGLRSLRGKAAPLPARLAVPGAWAAACLVPGFLASAPARAALLVPLALLLAVAAVLEALRARREQGLYAMNELLWLLTGFLALVPVRATEVLLLAGMPPMGVASGIMLVVLLAGTAFVGPSLARERAVRREAALRRAAAERAEAAEAMQRAVVENIGQAVMMWDADGRLLFSNRLNQDASGLPPALLTPGRPVREIFEALAAKGEFGTDPAERDRLLALALGKEDAGSHYERTRPDGTILEVRTFHLPDGRSVRTVSDITARKQAERNLAEARAKLQSVVDHLGIGILMLDEQRNVEVLNRAARELLGLPAEIARPGTPGREIVRWMAERGDFDTLPEAAREALLEGRQVRNTLGDSYERERPDGRIVEVRTHPVPGGGSLRTMIDITERKRTERALAEALVRAREAEATASAAIENISQGVMLVGEDSTVRLMNRRVVEMLGLPPDLARPGRPLREILDWQIASGEFAGQPEALARARDNRVQFDLSPGAHERRRPDGRVIEVRTHPVPGGGAVRTFTDITGRKREEEALAAARDAAEAAARARADFLAVMSHEIRTPLNAVIGLSGLLVDRADLPAEAAEQARLIRGAGDHLMALLNDVLDFTRLDAGGVTLEALDFSPAAELAGVLDMLRAQATAKGLALEMTVAPGVPAMVRGDPGRLRQILLNLVGNAVKFTETGSVRVTLAPDAEGETPRLAFAVEDSGIGIAPEDLDRLFDPFAQADLSISRRFGGSGLGLAICRRLIALMGGSIAVESEAGRGSTFRFVLPVQEAAATPAQPEEADAGAATTTPRLRVLLVEDNPTNRLVARTMLEKLGHRVDAVADGAEAVEAVRAFPYDAVVMDLMMPGMNGRDAARAIRALSGPRGRVPILAATASATAETEAACRAAGMNGLVLKPLTRKRLASAVAEVAAMGCAATE